MVSTVTLYDIAKQIITPMGSRHGETLQGRWNIRLGNGYVYRIVRVSMEHGMVTAYTDDGIRCVCALPMVAELLALEECA